MSLKRLQELMRDWEKGPSVAKVALYAGPARPRRRKFPARAVLEGVIAKALARNPGVAEPYVTRRVTAVCQRLGVPPPARMTVRRALEKARAARPEPFRIIDAPAPAAPVGLKPGERLLLTEEFFRAAVVLPTRQAVVASARLLIDIETSFIVGASPVHCLPQLAQEAAKALTEGGFNIGTWSSPRSLLLAADLSEDEQESLRVRSQKLGLSVEYALRRHVRRWTASLLRTGFEQLRLVPPPTRRLGPGPDWPQLTPSEFAYLLEGAVQAYRYDSVDRLDRRPSFSEYGPSGGQDELVDALTKLFGKE
jgi:hypothetical protein